MPMPMPMMITNEDEDIDKDSREKSGRKKWETFVNHYPNVSLKPWLDDGADFVLK